MTNSLTATTITFGTKSVPFTTVSDASAFFVKKFGNARRAPKCEILNGDTVVAHISPNGRVWAGSEWTVDSTPIFRPSYETAI